MGSSKKHKKHKDRKHSSSNVHDESNHSFNSISNNSIISGEQGTLKLVLRVPGVSTNSPSMSPSVHNQDYNKEHHHMTFGGLESSSNMLDRPYSSSSKKMKKKKSKKKHKKHSHHHHSHHHHSHHKHRSSCSHHSSKSSAPSSSEKMATVPSITISNQLTITNQLPFPPPQIQQPNLAMEMQTQHHYMSTSVMEFSQEPQQLQQPPSNLAIESAPSSLISTQQSPHQPSLTPIHQQQPFSPPNLPSLPPTVNLAQPQLLDQQPMNVTPITSPNYGVINNESNLNSNLFNANNYVPCSMVNNNAMINPVVSPISNNNYVPTLPTQTTMDAVESTVNLPQQQQIPPQQQMQTSPSQPIPSQQQAPMQLSPIQTSTISHQQPPAQPQLIRAPMGVKPIVKTQFQSLLGYLLKQLEKRDCQEFFFYPVTDLIAPGYSSIITKPMDFSKIRQKIDLNSYENLIQFRSDVKLMCDNAMTYNRPDTIYYKSARKLWHYAKEKIFNRDSVLELVKMYQGVTNYELGLTCNDYTDSEQINVPSYGDYSQMSEQMVTEQQTDYQLSATDEDQTKANISEEEMTPDQILEEVKKSSKEVADRLSLARPNGSQYTLLRQLKDGTTTLAIVGSNVNGYLDEKYVTLESIVGKLSEGAPHLPGFKEADLNIAKPIEPLPASPFSSYLPSSDSLKATLNEKETSLLMSAYGDETGLSYAESLLKFASDSDYVLTMVDSLLDALTNGQHTKIIDELKENRNATDDESTKKDVEMKDVEKKTTDEEIDDGKKAENGEDSLEKKLAETSSLVTDLESIQNQRLSSSTLLVKPNKDELKIANLLSNKLTDLISSYTKPADVSDLKSIRKALGVQMKSETINI